MSTQLASIKINIQNGKVDAKFKGTPCDVVEALAHMLIESKDVLMFFKAAVEVVEKHNQQKEIEPLKSDN